MYIIRLKAEQSGIGKLLDGDNRINLGFQWRRQHTLANI